jgi:hypothetical protein
MPTPIHAVILSELQHGGSMLIHCGRLLTLASSLLLLGAAQARVGFSGGEVFQAVGLEGEISLTCQEPGTGRLEHSQFRCSGEVLEPGEFSWFVGPLGVAGDSVELIAQHEDGSSRTKNEKYDEAAGRTSSAVNLWVWTLLQRPLLEIGKNAVSYRITKSSRETSSGQFEVRVERTPTRTCRFRRSYFSSNMQDCQTGGGWCGQYFGDESYCN